MIHDGCFALTGYGAHAWASRQRFVGARGFFQPPVSTDQTPCPNPGTPSRKVAKKKAINRLTTNSNLLSQVGMINNL
ncbi:MAG: hypothetical protein WCI88_13025 [Chloroflexota bacterium]